MKQKGYQDVGSYPYTANGPQAPKPLLDILIATSHTSHFHSINVAQNPSHYPFYARWLGSDAVAWIQDRLGAGVWYVADVEMGGEVNLYVAWLTAAHQVWYHFDRHPVCRPPGLEHSLRQWSHAQARRSAFRLI